MNFGILEKELEAAIAADEKYERENSAKFRAVEQKVASYDEFRFDKLSTVDYSEYAIIVLSVNVTLDAFPSNRFHLLRSWAKYWRKILKKSKSVVESTKHIWDYKLHFVNSMHSVVKT